MSARAVSRSRVSVAYCSSVVPSEYLMREAIRGRQRSSRGNHGASAPSAYVANVLADRSRSARCTFGSVTSAVSISMAARI